MNLVADHVLETTRRSRCSALIVTDVCWHGQINMRAIQNSHELYSDEDDEDDDAEDSWLYHPLIVAVFSCRHNPSFEGFLRVLAV